ncbi:MAG: GNAT family N-acetyltransferase [Planctomycetota bacterium]
MPHSSDPLQLRPFELADAEAVAPWLCGPGLQVPRGTSAWPERLVRDQRIVALVAQANGEKLGLVRLDCGPDGVADITLVVAPEHRRGGLGRQMFAQALVRARAVGMRRLVAYIDLNNEPALGFFGEVGFESQGVQGSRIRMERMVHAGGPTVPPLDVGV